MYLLTFRVCSCLFRLFFFIHLHNMAYPPQFIGFYYIIFGPLYSSSSSLWYLFRHCPLLHVGPYIIQRIFLLKILSLLSSFFVLVQVSVAHVNIDFSVQNMILLAAIRQFVVSSETLLLPVTNESRQVKLSTLS